MSDKNEYLDTVNEFMNPPPAPSTASVATGLALAADARPDYEAELMRLSAKTGVPLDTARNMPDEIRRQAFVIDANPGLLQTQYPKVADFLSMPDNAAVAKDDIGIMQAVSNLWASFETGISRGSIQDELGPLHYRALTGEITQGEEAKRQQLKSVMQDYGRAAAGETGFGYFLNQTGYAGRQLVSSIREGGKGALVGAAAGATAAAVVGQLGPQVALPEEIATVPAAAAIGARAGFVANSVVHNYQQEAGFAFDEFSDMIDRQTGRRLDPSVARGAAAAVGIINAGLETVGDLAMAKLLPGVGELLSQGGKGLVERLLARPTFKSAIANAGARWVKVATAEGLTEALQEVAGIIGGEIAQGVGGIEAADQQPPVERVLQAGRDAFVGALGVGAAGAGYQGYRDVQRARGAQQNQEFMQALGDASTESKLRQRLPEKWRELIGKIKEGGPVENVYIPAEQFTQYFQSAGVDPAEVAAEVGARNYAEAVAAGTDVVIPIEDYATFIAPTEHHAALMQDARLHPGDMTPREAEAFMAEREQRMREIAESLEAEATGETGQAQAYNTIRDEMMGELVGRFDRNTAEAYATLYARGISTLAERAGIDPLALHQRYGLTVGVQLPEVLQPGGQSDISIDPLLDRLRAGDIPTDDQIFGERLSDFVRRRGGITDPRMAGELRDVDENDERAPGRRKLVQPEGGLSIDYMREAAAEMGYLPDDSTEADFLNLLDEDLRVRPVYVPGYEDSNLLALRDTLNTVDDWLRENGIDLATMTNDEVRAALEAAGQYTRPGSEDQVYEQAGQSGVDESQRKSDADTIEVDGVERPTRNSEGRPIHPTEEGIRNFWRWFGDSRVVDDQGRPLVVYHGVKDADMRVENRAVVFAPKFDVFDTKGRTEPGAWFSPDPKVAAKYGTTIPFYLKAVAPVREEGPLTAAPENADAVYRMRGKGDSIAEAWEIAVFRPDQIKSATGNVGAFDPADANILNQTDRGFIQFGPDRRFRITLLDGADLSTFLHETGHFWLEVLGDLAGEAGSAQQIKDDYATILRWFGVESRDQIETRHHEQFARGFEAYLMEGKAPSPALRSIFQRFKAWLTLIYRRIAALDVELTPQVRAVFDRILASDAEIEAAQDETGLTAIFATAADAGMTEQEFEAYRRTVEAASEVARDDLQQKLMAEYRRAQKQWWKEQRKKVEAEVAEEVNALPVYQAFESLSVGRLPNGQPIKLNKADLVERYGAEYVKRLPRGRGWVYAVEGGWPADLAAEALGYSSADSLVEALVNMRPKRALIEAETDARMRERHGDMLVDGSMHEQALEAVHNDQRANVIAAELRALRRREREVRPFLRAAERERAQGRRDMQDSIPPLDAIRSAAAGMIGQKQVRDLEPNAYLTAERKASREAFDAAARGDWQVAAAAKQRELLNHFLYREAVKAQREIEAVQKYATGLMKPAAQQRIGKAGGDYLDQINALLEQYEFKKVSGRQLDRRRNLLAWYEAQVAAGYNPAISPELLESANLRNYREVPIDELLAVRDALKSIEHLARLKNKLLLKNAEIEFSDAIGELVGAAQANTKPTSQRSVDRALKTNRERVGDWFRSWDTDILPIETVIDWLDGGRADGPWHRYIFNRASEAQTAELDLLGDLGGKIAKLLEDFHLDNRSYLLEQFTFPGVGTVSRHWLISVALNVGNEQNYDKLLRGNNLTAGQVDEMLAKLSSEDWQFVQSVWDTVNSLWPQIAALEERVSGVAPEKIEARPFQVRDAQGNVLHEVRGGYYPLVYDPRYSQAGQKQESGPLAGLIEQGYAAATTPKGHTKARTDFAAPLLLDFGFVLQRHMASVVKDVTHRDFLIDANRIINNPEIRRTLQTQLGEQYEAMFMPWLRAVANDRNVSPSDGLTGLDRLIETARTNTTTVALGYKVTTMFAQAAGVINAMEIVGTKWFSAGFMQALRNPRESYQTVVEKSGEMRHRFDTIDRDVRDELRAMRAGNVDKWRSAVNRGAFIGINIADRMVTIPTWLGAYNKALAEGMAEAEAIHQADAAVRRSQGAGGAKDLSAIQRKRGAIKMLTMFYTPFAAQYGRIRTAGQRLGVEGVKYAPEAIMRVLMITAFPAMLADLLTGKGPTECAVDDPSCYAKWAAIKTVFSVSDTVPLLREIGDVAEKMVNGNLPGSRDMRVSPVIDTLNRVGNTVIKGFDAAFGDRPADEDFWFDLMETSGYVVNLPTGQARITIQYLYDLLAGNSQPDGPGDVLHGLVFRRKEGE